jgi:hypothetical protein
VYCLDCPVGVIPMSVFPVYRYDESYHTGMMTVIIPAYGVYIIVCIYSMCCAFVGLDNKLYRLHS